MIVNANPWDNLKFDSEGVREVQRRFFGTLQNTYSFFALYANLDHFTYSEKDIPSAEKCESDRWVISRLNTIIKSVREGYEQYEPTKAARAIQNFVVDDLSNWYVRLNRKRYWKPSGTGVNEKEKLDKLSAYQTLYTCLITIAKLGSPIAPFFMDKLFQDLNEVTGKEDLESVHLSLFPDSDNSLIERELEQKMEKAQTISSLAHSLRRKHKIKVRQPLSRILIPVLNTREKEQIKAVEDLVKTEINVKAIEYIDDTSGVLVKKIKPNFRKLGQVYGPRMKEISQAIQALDQQAIQEFESNGSSEFKLPGGDLTLSLDDVEISSEDIPGWTVASENNLTVALDITITDQLKKEGIARDLVNRVQNMRKDMGLDVQDKIRIRIEKNEEPVNQALEENKEYICQETQALQLEITDKLTGGTPVEMDDLKLIVKIERESVAGKVS